MITDTFKSAAKAHRRCTTMIKGTIMAAKHQGMVTYSNKLSVLERKKYVGAIMAAKYRRRTNSKNVSQYLDVRKKRNI